MELRNGFNAPIYLTQQCLIDFKDFIRINHAIGFLAWNNQWNVSDFMIMSEIKKFFESHNIQFGIEPMQGGEIRGFILDNKFTHHWIDDRFETEEELTIALIKKANLIYNNK